ncbi:MAG: ABC transporter ATP-binding protein, partial [Dehalococcoidia bacterium]
MPQSFSLAGEMRVLDTIAYAAWVNGTARKRCDSAAERALAKVRLDEHAGAKVRTLSGGLRKRVG